MSKGDQLASGGRQATFQAAKSESEFAHDLKIHSAAYIFAKYKITPIEYEDFVEKLKRGEALPDLEPNRSGIADPFINAPEPVFMPENIPVNGALPVETKPSVGYEGDPAGDCVLIQRVEREHTSNLILPDSLKAKSDIGFVKAVGEAVKYWKPGNLVLFDKFASHGADISLIDEEGVERHMLLLREYDILMRLKKVSLQNS